MMMRVVVAAICALSALLPARAMSQSLKPVGVIDLPGPKGQRFDYLTVDPDDHYLLSAHLGPGLLYVIDVRSNSLVKAIPGVPGITGVEYVPGVRKVYTSNWGEQKIGVVDLKQMKVVKRLPTGDKPNGSVFAEGFGKVYISNTNGKAVTVVRVDTDEIVKTLDFGSETGMPQYDSVAKKVYVNLRSTNEIAAIDPATDSIVARYAVEGCRFNHGMALDSEHHRAFLLCGGNRTFTVLALDTHKTLAHFPLPQGADVVKYDPGLRRAYAACSSGFISMVQADDVDHFRKLEDFPVQKLVHSLAVDTQTHRVYAPEQQEDGQPVARIVIYEPSSTPKT
jgi:DNA-binding beta-propeller fold protein YncE